VIWRGDIVCRRAGDELVILLVGTCDRAALDDMTQRINARLAEPMTVAGSPSGSGRASAWWKRVPAIHAMPRR
jgi:GGDEF domain-containing protein